MALCSGTRTTTLPERNVLTYYWKPNRGKAIGLRFFKTRGFSGLSSVVGVGAGAGTEADVNGRAVDFSVTRKDTGCLVTRSDTELCS